MINKFLKVLFCILFTTQANAQWKWTLHAETGLNKQDVSAVSTLVQQNELDPKVYWKFAASGGVELSYTVLKFATVFSGLGYVKSNGRYVTSQNAYNPDGSLQATYTSDKLTTADMISLPIGLQLNAWKLHLGGGLECRYRVAGSMTTNYSSIAAFASNRSWNDNWCKYQCQIRLWVFCLRFIQFHQAFRLQNIVLRRSARFEQ